uniref:hypothetical protein n=1 Tax=Ideonella sp. A 288 TaxID=1962181 RepID=UPI0011847516
MNRSTARAATAVAIAAVLATLGAAAAAQDRADLERARIIGNRELPKVLYIVPWKKPLSAAGIGRPAGGVLDDALQPIDREVFRRGLRFDAQLRARSADEAAAAPA